MSDIQSIFAIDREIDVFGKKVKVKSICLGDLPKAMVILKVFMSSKDKKSVIIDILHDKIDLVYDLFAMTTDLDKEDIKKLNIGAASVLLNEIITENADFLVKHVIPQMEAMTKSMVGLTKSKS